MQRIRSFPDEATKIKFISFMVSLLFIGIGAFLLYIVSDFYSYIENHPPYQMNTFTYKSRTIVQLNDSEENIFILCYFLFCSISISTGFLWLFTTLTVDVGIFRLIQIALSILSVVSSLVGSISPYVFLRGLEPHSFTDRSDEYNKQVKRLNYKIFLIMATFGIMFMISCFSVYAYWRTIPMRNPRFEITVSYNQSEFNDKPPAYDSLSFPSPPPLYNTVVKDCSPSNAEKYTLTFL